MVEILLATYNSSHFLKEQLESLFAQTHKDWFLSVHDGGSDDETLQLLQEYASLDSRVRLLGSERMTAKENFSFLWEQSSADYVMFCDHDDVWYPDKIERELSVMRRIETENPQVPILVFTDARVVDKDLNTLSESSFAWQGLNPRQQSLRRLLMQNVAAGNTILVNRVLRERCGLVPVEAVMHDHWLMLCAACFGRIECLPVPTLDYRQHGDNVYGATVNGLGYYARRLVSGRQSNMLRFRAKLLQGEMFYSTYCEQLPESDCKVLAQFSRLRSASWIMRRWIMLRYGFFQNGWMRNIGMFLIV